MCKKIPNLTVKSSLLICICVLVSGVFAGGCASNAPHNQAVSLRCSSQCNLDFTIKDGHLKVSAEEITRNNCSVHVGGERITVACPADLSQWSGALDRPREYPAMPNATS